MAKRMTKKERAALKHELDCACEEILWFMEHDSVGDDMAAGVLRDLNRIVEWYGYEKVCALLDERVVFELRSHGLEFLR